MSKLRIHLEAKTHSEEVIPLEAAKDSLALRASQISSRELKGVAAREVARSETSSRSSRRCSVVSRMRGELSLRQRVKTLLLTSRSTLWRPSTVLRKLSILDAPMFVALARAPRPNPEHLLRPVALVEVKVT